MISNIKYEDLLLKISEEFDDIDFVGFCITPWHLIGIKAFLNKLSMNGKKNLNGIIIINKHPITGSILCESDILLTENIKVTSYKLDITCKTKRNVKEIFKSLFFTKSKTPHKEIFILTPKNPNVTLAFDYYILFNKKLSLIVIDEGVSTYHTKLGWIRHSFFENRSLKLVFRIIKGYFFIFIINLFIKFKIEKFTIFSIRKGKLLCNNQVLEYYKNIYNLNAPKIEIPYKKYIMIISQPAVKSNDKYKDLNLLIYSKLADYFLKLGYKTVIKPHPRENNYDFYENNGMHVLRDKISLEELIPKLSFRPIYIIGMTSTGLITANLFFNIKTISVVKILYSMNRKKIPYEIRFFINKFNDYTLFIDSLPEYKGEKYFEG